MPDRVIKITKGRIWLRKFIERATALITFASRMITGKQNREDPAKHASGGVIRILGKSIEDIGRDCGEGASPSLGWPTKSAANVGAVKADLAHDAQRGGLYLTAPPDRATVSERSFVEGRIADRSARVWVVVHPMETSDYWVQPPVSVREDGSWKVKVYIGRPGMVDVGQHFEITVCGNPRNIYLAEGMVLSWWPEAEWQSSVIEVVRG